MSKPIDGVGLFVTVTGGVLVYAGIRGYSLLAVMQNLVIGKPITTGVAVTNPLQTPGSVESVAGGEHEGPIYTGGSPKEIGQRLAAGMGWTGAQWKALETLWTGESGWNPKAKNKSSGAYGIPQALPHTKMPKAAWPESAGGKSDAATQIQWGLSYIKQRYGTPQMALAFWQRQHPHWY
jgi:hypothetical protein